MGSLQRVVVLTGLRASQSGLKRPSCFIDDLRTFQLWVMLHSRSSLHGNVSLRTGESPIRRHGPVARASKIRVAKVCVANICNYSAVAGARAVEEYGAILFR